MILFNVITLLIVFSLFCVIIALCLCMNSNNWRDENHDYELDEIIRKHHNHNDTNVN